MDILRTVASSAALATVVVALAAGRNRLVQMAQRLRERKHGHDTANHGHR